MINVRNTLQCHRNTWLMSMQQLSCTRGSKVIFHFLLLLSMHLYCTSTQKATTCYVQKSIVDIRTLSPLAEATLFQKKMKFNSQWANHAALLPITHADSCRFIVISRVQCYSSWCFGTDLLWVSLHQRPVRPPLARVLYHSLDFVATSHLGQVVLHTASAQVAFLGLL